MKYRQLKRTSARDDFLSDAASFSDWQAASIIVQPEMQTPLNRSWPKQIVSEPASARPSDSSLAPQPTPRNSTPLAGERGLEWGEGATFEEQARRACMENVAPAAATCVE